MLFSNPGEYPKITLNEGGIYEYDGIRLWIGAFHIVSKVEELIEEKIADREAKIIRPYEHGIMREGGSELPNSLMEQFGKIKGEMNETDYAHYPELLETIGVTLVEKINCWCCCTEALSFESRLHRTFIESPAFFFLWEVSTYDTICVWKLESVKKEFKIFLKKTKIKFLDLSFWLVF